MSVQITPVICTRQQVYDFCNISAAQAAANLPNGGTPLNLYIQALMDRTATLIVNYLGYDYTAGQIQRLVFFGNNSNILKNPFPIASFNFFKSWDPENPTTTPIDIGVAQLSILGIDPYTIFRNDNKLFDCNLQYLIEAVQAADPRSPSGWPIDIIQIQIDAIATIYKDSWNLSSSFDLLQDGDSQFHVTKFKNMEKELKDKIRPYRRFAA